MPLFRRWRVRIDPASNKLGDTFSALGRHYKPISFHNRAARHSRATLQPLNVPQQGCAAPLGNTLPLFRRRNIRIDPVMNKPGDTFGTAYTLGRRYKPISSPNRAARHSRATLQAYIVSQQFCATPSGNALPLFRRWRVRIEAVLNKPGDTFSTLGRRFKPTSFPNRAARHSRATLQPLNVPQQGCAAPRATLCPFFVARESALIPSRISSETPSAPLGDITSLYRSTTEPCDILGRHYCPKTFPNRAVRYPWATLKPRNVPQQFCAAPSGNTSPLFRRRNVRINPLSNKP